MQCMNVCMNVCMNGQNCTLKRFEWSSRLEKCYINKKHLPLTRFWLLSQDGSCMASYRRVRHLVAFIIILLFKEIEWFTRNLTLQTWSRNAACMNNRRPRRAADPRRSRHACSAHAASLARALLEYSTWVCHCTYEFVWGLSSHHGHFSLTPYKFLFPSFLNILTFSIEFNSIYYCSHRKRWNPTTTEKEGFSGQIKCNSGNTFFYT